LRKAKDDVKAKQDNLTALVDSNKLHLPSSCPVQASADAGATSGNTTDAGQSERETIKALASIAADGDIAITQLNACIDTYQKVREMVNVKP